MATVAAPSVNVVSVDEYLRSSYRPDCDYIDGEVRERNLGEMDHSRTQGRLLYRLTRRYLYLLDRALPEQRVQVKTTRFRIPDVCVTAPDAPFENIVVTPPLLCIEILSKDDTIAEITERLNDYFEMGVANCWVLDPVRNRAWSLTARGELTEAFDGVLRAGAIEVSLGEIFS